ncbi:MAG: MFS transporter [Pseudonocardiales bacterium]|nr:MFS transporter [Pseudonocardiales bacterium]MBV9029132.1 MFS transporter [Pseudonocardiales bacterium]
MATKTYIGETTPPVCLDALAEGTRTGITRRKVYGSMFEIIRPHWNHRLFFGGQLVSQTASWTQKVAQMWFVLSVSNSGSALGVLIVCQSAPYAIFGFFGKTIGGRLDSYRTLIVTQAMMMLCAGVLTALTFSGSLTVWVVDTIAAIQGVTMIVDTPVRQAFVTQMVGREHLSDAIALNVSLGNIAQTIGPALGAVAIIGMGLKVGSLANALGFVTMLAGLLLMRTKELHRPGPPAGVEARVGEILQGAIEGLRLTWGKRQMTSIMVMVFVVETFGISFNVTLPLVAHNTLHGNPEILGVLFACYSTGWLVGTLYVATRGWASWAVLLGACGVLGAFELLLALQGTVAGCAVMLVCIGAAFSCFTYNASSTLRLRMSEPLCARMRSLYSYSWVGAAPLGGLLAAWLSDRGGPALVFAVGGVAMAASAAMATLGRGRAGAV